MRPKTRTAMIIGAGVLFVVVGVLLVLVWSSFAALYVPECPKFSLSAEHPHCRDPLYWIYGGYALTAVGLGTLGYPLVRHILRPRQSTG